MSRGRANCSATASREQVNGMEPSSQTISPMERHRLQSDLMMNFVRDLAQIDMLDEHRDVADNVAKRARVLRDSIRLGAAESTR